MSSDVDFGSSDSLFPKALQDLLVRESKDPVSAPHVRAIAEGFRQIAVRLLDREDEMKRDLIRSSQEASAVIDAALEAYAQEARGEEPDALSAVDATPYEATGVHSSDDVQGIADRILVKLREAPDDDARLEVLAPIFDAYCKLCGSDRGRDCQCWNDE